MALATRGPGFCQDDVVREEWGFARELGIPITTHIAMGKLAGKWNMVKQLDGLGLLCSDTTYIHCCYFDDEEWDLVAKSQGKISIAPQVEMQMGHGWPPFMKAREHGLRPSLSIDVVTTVPGDMFTEMRCAFAAERWRSNDTVWESEEPVPDTILTARDMLTMATLDGAHVAGLEDRTGSLTPGKQADVVVIDGRAPATSPVIDPVATVVLCADTANVDTVIIGGKVHKRDGKLAADWDSARQRLQESSDYLVDALAKKQQEQPAS
jgi:5-methylthioadenosine/S-adenosylhomocysteine deaminase